MKRLPGWLVEPYAIRDAQLTLRLYRHYAKLITAEGLDRVFELERECALVAVDMKERGVRIDMDRAAREMAAMEVKRDAALRRIYDATGVRATATDDRALVRALKIEDPSLSFPTTATGKESIRKEVLESVKTPVGDAIRDARRYDKTIGTFFMGYIFGGAVKGRIHADFHPLRRESESGGMGGTISGRFSSSDPNLQNLPARDPEIGPLIRGCFLPEEGEDWGTFDYSSQEPRIATHFAAAVKLPGAMEMVERFRANPRTDLHQETAVRMNIKRGDAKTINLAILYGAGGKTICQRLGLPTEWKIHRTSGRRYEAAGPEGARLIRQHEQSMPFMRKLQEKAQEMAEKRGWVSTILGRRCHFEKRGDEYMWAYAALNRVVQGSAADQGKRGLVLLRRAGIPILFPVHDSSEMSLPRGAEGRQRVARITEIMEGAIEFLVPSVVDVKVAADWGGTKG
jgi:DNA polymerase I-like protein with 3'-5' exonuclease and polymerase domains